MTSFDTVREALKLGGAATNAEIRQALDALSELERQMGEPVAWKHDCAALLANDVELWIDNCPHCGRPRAAPPAQQPQLMVDMVPPATVRDRWMFEQGRLAERDPRTHEALCERICAAIKAADDKSVDEADYMLDSDDCIRIVREQFATTPPAQQPQARPDFTDEWTGYLKDGETPFERFLRERKDLDALAKLYQRALEENKQLKSQQPLITVEDSLRFRLDCTKERLEAAEKECSELRAKLKAQQPQAMPGMGKKLHDDLLAAIRSLIDAQNEPERWGCVGPDASDIAWGKVTQLVNYICVALDSPPTPQQAEAVPAAMKVVLEAMRSDPDYAWSWHCNVAMAFVDAGGGIYTANQGAARFMRLLAGVEPAHELPEAPQQAEAVPPSNLIDPGSVVSFAVDRWLAEVSNRPLVNKNRRTLDDTWRQVIRRFGGDPDALLGPSHDELAAIAQQKGQP